MTDAPDPVLDALSAAQTPDAPQGSATLGDPTLDALAAAQAPESAGSAVPPIRHPAPQSHGPTQFKKAAAPPVAAKPEPELSWGQVGQQALANAPASIGQGFGGIWNAVTHPAETLGNIGNLATGAASQLGIGDQSPTQKAKNEALVKAVEDHYVQGYGSVKGFKKNLATDPFGVAMDASMLADPAAGVLGKVGEAGKLGVISDAARVASKALPYVNPVRSAIALARAPGAAASWVGRGVGSVTSRVPLSALKLATQIGANGDPLVQGAFSRFASGQGDATEFSQAAQGALSQIKQDASDAYVAGKSALLDRPVPMTSAYAALDKADKELGMGAASGWPEAKQAIAQARGLVDQFSAKASPADQNIVNADALKQQIYNLHDSFGNSKAGQYLDQVYHGVKGDITAVDPKYADLMDQYQQGRANINDLTKTLGLGKNAAASGALVKGLRAIKTGTGGNLLDQLTAKNPAIAGMLAGQAINPWTQHASLWETAIGAGLPSVFAHPLGAMAAVPGAAIGYGVSSPRIVGSAANLAGKASRVLNAATSPVAQAGAKAAYYGGRPDALADNTPSAGLPPGPGKPPIPATAQDADTATRMIMTEAGGEPDVGKAAALYAFINRAAASGKSLSQEITTPWASESTTRGLGANIDPNSPAYKYIHDNIVVPALNGQIGDPTGGMTHFLNKTLQTSEGRAIPAWAQGNGEDIGRHTFYQSFGGRVPRKDGGKVEDRHEELVWRLMAMAKRAKKSANKATEPLLHVPDNTVARALEVSGRGI